MDDTNIRKSLNLIVLCAGMGIFFLVIFLRVELFAKQTQAEVKLFILDTEWQNFQYQQVIRQEQGTSSPNNLN